MPQRSTPIRWLPSMDYLITVTGSHDYNNYTLAHDHFNQLCSNKGKKSQHRLCLMKQNRHIWRRCATLGPVVLINRMFDIYCKLDISRTPSTCGCAAQNTKILMENLIFGILAKFGVFVFGHNLPTTNARWPIKGPKDIDLHLVFTKNLSQKRLLVLEPRARWPQPKLRKPSQIVTSPTKKLKSKTSQLKKTKLSLQDFLDLQEVWTKVTAKTL